MGLFAYIKNGVKYKMNQFPGAYPASRVSYNGSDVETALDELNADLSANNLGSAVDISAYNTTSNLYVVPSAGYVFIGSTPSNPATCSIYGSTSGLSNALVITCPENYNRASMPVKKGMRIQAGANNQFTRFVPLTES